MLKMQDDDFVPREVICLPPPDNVGHVYTEGLPVRYVTVTSDVDDSDDDGYEGNSDYEI